MEQLLASLGALLLKAVPTFLLIVFLNFYLKRVYFRPMQRVLAERYAATEGARKLAEESLAKASGKAAEYETALRSARAEIYREQEEFRQSLRQEQGRRVLEARRAADQAVKQAREQLAAELDTAKESLRRHTDSLAEEIVAAVLDRRAA
jgi:F-type H+-transporting ATPase subunit b